jgi:hypothetical protein
MENKESTTEEKQKYWQELVERVTASFNSSNTTTTYAVSYLVNEKFTRKEFSDAQKAVNFYKEQVSNSNTSNLPFFIKHSVIPVEGNYHDPNEAVSKNALLTSEIEDWEQKINKILIQKVVSSLFKKKFGDFIAIR